MPGTCNDCGQGFKGTIEDHVKDAHPGLPRFRFRDVKGVNHLICPECGEDVVEGGPQHLSKTGTYTPGKSDDPKDFFDIHMQSHRAGEA